MDSIYWSCPVLTLKQFFHFFSFFYFFFLGLVLNELRPVHLIKDGSRVRCQKISEQDLKPKGWNSPHTPPPTHTMQPGTLYFIQGHFAVMNPPDHRASQLPQGVSRIWEPRSHRLVCSNSYVRGTFLAHIAELVSSESALPLEKSTEHQCC